LQQPIFVFWGRHHGNNNCRQLEAQAFSLCSILIEISAALSNHLPMTRYVFTGPVYVVRDNIDTDQIISAQYLNLVPTIPEEYEKLGSYALAGLPESLYTTRYVKAGKLDSDYPIVVAGKNFGCGSSREHAPQALMRYGIRALIGESFAEIFAGNCAVLGVPVVRAAQGDIEKLRNRVEADPQTEIRIDLVSMQATAGNLKITIHMPDSVRLSLTEGLWDTPSLLLANRDKIQRISDRLGYVRGFS
jgi:3-isopropylmalate dehydratase small subunit